MKHNFKNLNIWKQSIDLAVDIYEETENFPKSEEYGLKSQLRRCAVSVPSNIAEGSGRSSDKDFCRFLYISFGSANELEYQIFLSIELNFLEKEQGQIFLKQIEEVKKMLNGLITKLNNAES